MICASDVSMESLVKVARDLSPSDLMLALVSLLKTLKISEKTFLHVILSQLITADKESGQPVFREMDLACTDLLPAQLAQQPLDKLMTLLLLLKPEQERAKEAVGRSIEELYHLYSKTSEYKLQMQQILSIANIHPAFSADQKNLFANWKSAMESNTGLDQSETPSSPISCSSPGSLSSLGSSQNSLSPSSGISVDSDCYNEKYIHPPLQAALSAPPPRKQETLELKNAESVHLKLRSQSSSPCGGSSSLSASESNANLSQQVSFIVPKPGMKDVPAWLKGLRLHKYCSLLASKSYDELLGINEAQLEQWNVTKGARNKILISIQKLRDRSAELSQLYQNMISVSDIKSAMGEIREILSTPIKHTGSPCTDLMRIRHVDDVASDDIAGKITCVLRKALNIRLNTAVQANEDDCVILIAQLADRCIRHEAFYGSLRSALHSIKQNLHSFLRPTNLHGHRKVAKSYTSAADYSAAYPLKAMDSLPSFPTRSQEMFLAVPNANDTFPDRTCVHRPLRRTYGLGPISSVIVAAEASKAAAAEANKAAAGETNNGSVLVRSKNALHRTRSEPVAPRSLTSTSYFSSPLKIWFSPKHFAGIESNMWFDRIDKDLESLTLSVTEHALDNFEQTNF